MSERINDRMSGCVYEWMCACVWVSEWANVGLIECMYYVPWNFVCARDHMIQTTIVCYYSANKCVSNFQCQLFRMVLPILWWIGAWKHEWDSMNECFFVWVIEWMNDASDECMSDSANVGCMGESMRSGCVFGWMSDECLSECMYVLYMSEWVMCMRERGSVFEWRVNKWVEWNEILHGMIAWLGVFDLNAYTKENEWIMF